MHGKIIKYQLLVLDSINFCGRFLNLSSADYLGEFVRGSSEVFFS